jgi:hypothetical protein
MLGRAIDAVEGRDPDGAPLRVTVGPGDRLVLAFLTSSCVACRPFWEGAGAASAGEPAPGEVAPAMVIVTPDPETEDRGEVRRRRPDGLPVVMSTATWLTLGVGGSPFFVVVAGGRIRAEGFASSWAELLALIGP